MATIIEPFRIKSVEPLHFTTPSERKEILQKAKNNLFLVESDHVLIDLLTDSGTSAMSARQWAGMMVGDESYAGSPSFYRFRNTVQKITGFTHIIPTHQGRAAEKILFTLYGGKGKHFVSNTFFDTTRGNIEYSGAEAWDFLTEEGKQPHLKADFKGNLDIPALEKFIAEKGAENIPMCVMTITNNSGGGQPVSLQNMKETAALCKKHGILFFIDACRFAENAYFIKLREKGQENRSVAEIAREIFSLADGCTMSAKKDALVNIGGFLAMNDDEIAREAKNLLIITEGFPTYGGLAGRDLEAMAQGLEEVLDEEYLKYRLRSIEYMGEKLEKVGVPMIQPTGGHALYLDAKAFLPHIPPHEFPGVALANALYLEGGIRGVEIGSLMFGKYNEQGQPIAPPMELVRLAIPRRVYTQSHIDYVCEIILEVFAKRNTYKGYKIGYEAPLLRHFTAELEAL
ncbi:tryptophanase [Leadbetterella byssophila DSM 17132]|uniref:Tryptophanase n=1 Tax=Leadbetterella byssophila (strain DSM 17132 / JCM 16389 / KACC 11308 / NBRC 106382 / 4M15) TaxID=649349 RepID=E4RYV7_LEAB4|nr:tryptophanase [Leadbetterella byssophila]ADQ17354.1 tryptophanase [Leadbetterella byssophila DSM 17132]